MNKFEIGSRVKYSPRFIQHLDEIDKLNWINLRGTVIKVKPQATGTFAYGVDWGDWQGTSLEIHLATAVEMEIAQCQVE